MKEINLREIPYYQILRTQRRFWLIPVGLGLLTAILLFLQLVVAGVPDQTEEEGPSQSEQEEMAQRLANQKEIIAGTVEAQDPVQEPSFLHETEEGWQLLTRSQAFGNPEDWHVILIMNQGKVQPTIFSTEPKTFSPAIEGGRKLVFEHYEKREQGVAQISFDRSRKKRFALQLTSQPEEAYDELVKLALKLSYQGHPAYLMRTEEPVRAQDGKSRYYYKLRIGFFEAEEEARDLGNLLKTQMPGGLIPETFWAAYPEYLEMSGELVNFAGQRVRPMILELNPVAKFEDALKQLRLAQQVAEHAFLSQKRNKKGNYIYRLRLGFFDNYDSAQKAIDKMRIYDDKLFPQGKIQTLKYGLLSPTSDKEDLTRIVRP